MTSPTLSESTLEDCIRDFKNKDIGTLIYVSATGSTLHGTVCASSDMDYKGLFLPSIEHLMIRDDLSQLPYVFECKGKKFEVTFIAVQEFLDKLMRMESNAVELLFSMDAKHVVLSGPISKYLRQECDKLLTKNISSFWGMAKSEMVRYEKNKADCKDIAHGVRSGAQARQLLEYGKLTFPIPNLDLIKRIKFGEIPIKDAYTLMELQFHILENPKEEATKEQHQIKRELILKLYSLLAG